MLKIKPENLTEAGSFDQIKFGVGMLYQSAKAYVASPSMQEFGQNIIDRLPPSVQSKMTPNLAILAAAAIAALSALFVLYLILGRFLGFQKIFMFVSLIALLLAVSSPDWMEGYKANKPFKLIARNAGNNFPRRWKENLVSMTGYANISDTMALASLVLVLLFSGKMLLTSSPSSRSPHMSMNVGNNNLQRTPPPRAPQYDLEYIYKLGYDDGKEGKDFKTSLPDDIIKYNAAQEEVLPAGANNGYNNDENFDWAYNPPPRSSKPSLGMGTMLSFFTLYRFGKDIVTSPDGRILLNPQYVVTRLRSMEPWRLGMIGFSLYRVVTALSSFIR